MFSNAKFIKESNKSTRFDTAYSYGAINVPFGFKV